MKHIYSSSFEDPGQWLAETNGRVVMADGAFDWDCLGASVMGTVWCRRRFEGPIAVEYDVECLAGANNMNFILCARTEDADLLETTGRRTGIYAEYQVFPNYIATYLTDPEGRTRVRFRRDPGFVLLSECFSDREIVQGRSIHVTTRVEAGGRICLAADGRELHSAVDPDPLPLSGYLGLRTWNTHLRYRNFKVFSLRPDESA